MGADWAAPIVDAATSFASGNPGRIVENPYILCVSTLEYRKNHKRLLEAFAEVRRHVKNVDLVLVGGIDSSISEGTLEFCRRNPWVQHFERVDDTPCAVCTRTVCFRFIHRSMRAMDCL